MEIPQLEIFIDPDTLAEIQSYAKKKYSNTDAGIVLNDPSCCGGVIKIDIFSEGEIKGLTDLRLIFPPEYKNFGIPIYMEQSLLQDSIPRIRILLKSRNPVKFEFENEDIYSKNQH